MRSSITTKAARQTAATTYPMMISPLRKPTAEPWVSAHSSATRPTARASWPGTSSLRPSGADEFFDSSETTNETTAAAMTTPYAPRQLPYFANRPAISGETAAPMDRKPAHRAMAFVRASRLGATAAIIASEIG